MKSIDDGLKQRLIGAVVLLALAVIFIPVLFDRDKIEPIDQTTQIPPPPDIEPLTIPEPTPEPVEEAAVAPKTMFAPDEKQVQDLEDEPIAQQPSGEPKAWVLQVASYRFSTHAAEMRKQLSDMGYATYTREVPFKGGQLTRVYIGPKIDKSKLLEAKKRVDAKFDVDTLLLQFESAP